MQLAVFPPALDIAVNVAVPFPTAVITPSFTLATFSLLELQYNTLSLAFSGSYIAPIYPVFPSSTVTLLSFNLIPVSGTCGLETITLHFAIFCLFPLIAVIVASPSPFA